MIRDYHTPERIDEALALVARGAVPIGGGTNLYTARSSRAVELVDVTRLGLDQVKVEQGRIVIGAAVTLSQLAGASGMPGMAGALLRKAARAVASEPLRNMITVGGNVAGLNYWADLPPVLLSLDAKVQIQRAGAPQVTEPMAACMQPGKHPWEGGLITAIEVPTPAGVQVFGYERFVRTVTDYSLATACVTMTRQGESFRDVRVVIAAIQSRPWRAQAVESALEGKGFDAAAVKAAVALLGEVAVAPNYRASAAYRRQLVSVLTERALMTAYQWAKES